MVEYNNTHVRRLGCLKDFLAQVDNLTLNLHSVISQETILGELRFIKAVRVSVIGGAVIGRHLTDAVLGVDNVPGQGREDLDLVVPVLGQQLSILHGLRKNEAVIIISEALESSFTPTHGAVHGLTLAGVSPHLFLAVHVSDVKTLVGEPLDIMQPDALTPAQAAERG